MNGNPLLYSNPKQTNKKLTKLMPAVTWKRLNVPNELVDLVKDISRRNFKVSS